MNDTKTRILDAVDRMDEQAQNELAQLAESFAELFPKLAERPLLSLVASNRR